MKTILIICSVIISAGVYCQSSAPLVNAATNTKKITSSTNPLYKTSVLNAVQIQSALEIKSGSVVSYKVNFILSDPSLITGIDAQPNTCLLTDKDGKVYKGVLDDEAAPQVYTCAFSKDVFYKIVDAKITAVEITDAESRGILIRVPKQMQENFSVQAKALLDELNSQ